MSTAIEPPQEARAASQVGPVSLLDQLLAEQRELTAVERFAQLHADELAPLEARYYTAPLPATPPQPGEQYAFEVDLDLCSGCKSCVTACHTLNGLDEDETWRDVGLLHGGTAELPILQHATTACHHCLEPACLTACPVRAYEKHPATGIVKHLDDQCIGCQYCVFACPYEVPKYNERRGIVRKCDMCSQRLEVGEAPACVQACPHQAIRIAVVKQQEIVANCETNLFLPGAPEPTQTLPTTNYKTSGPLPRNLLPADYYTVKPQHAHRPLIVMLVLTQLSVGAFLIELVMRLNYGEHLLAAIRPVHSASALLFGVTALAVSVLHLGRPRYAYRAVLGLGTSWLSREIVAFGLFAGAAVVYAATTGWSTSGSGRMANMFAFAVVVLGLSGVACSIMVYSVTRRAFWNATDTALKFLLTTLVLGTATALLTSLVTAASFDTTGKGDGYILCEAPSGPFRQNVPVPFSRPATMTAREIMASYGRPLCALLVVAMALKLLVEATVFRHLCQKQNTPLRRSAVLMTAELGPAAKSRFICGFLGGIALPCMLLAATSPSSGTDSSDLFLGVVVSALFAACLAGELLERYLFFTAVAPPRMPGGLS